MGAGKGLRWSLEGGWKLLAVLTPQQNTQLKPDTMQPPTSIKPSKYSMWDMHASVYRLQIRVRVKASASARTGAQCYHL